MTQHPFIFAPGEWLGYGKLTFSSSPTVLQFYTKWKCDPIESGVIRCEQSIEKQGVEEVTVNRIAISDITAASFALQLQSEEVGTVEGRGMIDATTISWRFEKRVPFEGSTGFEGVESYSLLKNGEYQVHAEYIADFEHRTMIHGKLWRRS